jgi:hypothetical protein
VIAKNLMRIRYRLAMLFLAATPFASASLLLNPTGATPVGLSGLDNQVTRNLGGTFSLYGTNITSINIADDGILGTGNVGGKFLNQGLGSLAENTATETGAKPVIAAYYDLLTFAQGSTITDQSVADTYYAVTYQSLYAFSDTATGHSVDAQIILFMDHTTIGGFNFLAGDIAISYGTVNTKIEDHTFTVGAALNRDTFNSTPGSTDGQLSNFSTLPTGSQFFLFRPNQGTFDVSIEHSTSTGASGVPEPASLALAGIGLIGFGLFKSRKRNLKKENYSCYQKRLP